MYLRRANTRRIQGALYLLLRGRPLSKDALSWLLDGLEEEFKTWRARGLAEEDVPYL